MRIRESLVRHIDVKKVLYYPDDPSDKGNTQVKKYIKNHNVKFPPIMLDSVHSYFTRLSGNSWYVISYSIDPKELDGPNSVKLTEESSEYHRNNIVEYPEHKKTMDLWLSISANRHIEFEKMSRTKKRHLLDLISYEPIEYENKQIKKDSNDDDLLNDLNELIELYNSGILTKEEFEKAKKKILN
mgnify:CR=1 FL=1